MLTVETLFACLLCFLFFYSKILMEERAGNFSSAFQTLTEANDSSGDSEESTAESEEMRRVT
jgi:hypothetical protein